MRIDEELLNKMQASFWKKEALQTRIGVLQLQMQAVGAQVEKAQEEMAALLNVANNRYSVGLGQTHLWDPDTGEITEVTTPRLPTPVPPSVN